MVHSNESVSYLELVGFPQRWQESGLTEVLEDVSDPAQVSLGAGMKLLLEKPGLF